MMYSFFIILLKQIQYMYFKNIFLGIFTFLLLFNCNKIHQTPLSLEFKNSEGIEISTLNGNVFTIAPDSFNDEDGRPYEGEVLFELKEVYTKTEMIKNKLSTTSNGELLVSGGMFYISAQTKDGKELTLKKDIQLCAKLLESQKAYEDFYGERNPDGSLNWQRNVQHSSGGVGMSERHCMNNYLTTIQNLGWINCDYFYNGKRDGEIAIQSKEKDLMVNFIFDELNSIMSFTKVEEGYKLSSIPLNQKGKIIAYKENGQNILYFEKDFTIEDKHNMSISLEEISLTTFKMKIANL